MRINGAVLHRLRFLAGLTQAQLAEKAGLTHSTISRLESGEVGGWPSTIQALASVLDVAVTELCAEDGEAA